MKWDQKPYHSLDYELKKRFGEKVYKLSLNGGMTCPNRDGTLGDRGCIFCSEGGSGDFAGAAGEPIPRQIAAQKLLLKNKSAGQKYIAYFQAYTNTYAPVTYLKSLFGEAIRQPEIVALSIGTRPDCLPPDVLDLLAALNKIKPVWIELGLQTIHADTAAFIRRGYPLSCFEASLAALRSRGLEVIVHTILGLPGEDETRMLQTVSYLAGQDIQGIKLQLLHVLKHTDLAAYYQEHPIPDQDSYIRLVIRCLELLPPDLVIHRLTGDGPKDLLLAPLWSGHKRAVLNALHAELKRQNTWQGRRYPEKKEESHV